MDYLKALLPDPRTDVLLAGYQAEGTLGREIQAGCFEVEIDDEQIEVAAQIHTMSGYSAHADQSDLMRFIEGIPSKPKTVHLIHGEPDTQTQFAEQLRSSGYQVNQ